MKLNAIEDISGQIGVDHVTIPYIEGDGIGRDIWIATKQVIEAAVEKAYEGKKKINWVELLAGEKAYNQTGEWLPKITLENIKKYGLAIKGPLTTPVGGGFRSINVTIRQELDLYACVRPLKNYLENHSPVPKSKNLDVVLFRENSEDVYAGYEWQAGSEINTALMYFFKNYGIHLEEDTGLGLKPISKNNSVRIVRKAMEYAIENKRKRVTIVHKGNIMKYTEGAFKNWAYEFIKNEYGDKIITEEECFEKYEGEVPDNKILINDRIADNMFMQVILRSSDYDVIVTTNLNGDYLSDAISAQVGGLGMAPGVNMGNGVAVFEATHGSAPKYANLDKANPCSLIQSGVLMLNYLGWYESADLISKAIERTIKDKKVTYDLARLIEGSVELKTSEFADHIIDNMKCLISET